MTHFDTIIIGAGVAGSAAAYELSKTKRVLLLEQHDFLHTLGSSHGSSRIFRHAYEDSRYVTLALAADTAWQQLESDANERLLFRTGGLDTGVEGFVELTRIQEALKAAGRPFELLDAPSVNTRFPAFRLASNQVAIFQQDAGIVAASRALNAMLRTAASQGAVLLDKQPVSTLELRPDVVRVRTPAGVFEAATLVVTAGAWLGQVLGELALPVHVEQQQVLYVKMARPDLHTPNAMPVFINRAESAEVYGFPVFERPNMLKISDHSGAPTITLHERHTELMQVRAQATIARAKTFLPYLEDAVSDYQMCLYTKTPDEDFILDTHPEYKNVVIGGGFSGHGFKFGPVLGEIIAQLVEQGHSQHDLSLFKLSRLLQPES